MKLKRIIPGKYESSDGRYVIASRVFEESYYRGSKRHYRKSVGWTWTFGGVWMGDCDTKAEAVAKADRHFEKLELQRVIDFAARLKAEYPTS